MIWRFEDIMTDNKHVLKKYDLEFGDLRILFITSPKSVQIFDNKIY